VLRDRLLLGVVYKQYVYFFCALPQDRPTDGENGVGLLLGKTVYQQYKYLFFAAKIGLLWGRQGNSSACTCICWGR
jgi:hypothetical protein